ncbi:MAG: CBS domain-containing protein [Ardenticatenaceae bacterium]|nr:CBS domain-containing protein [Anaerolineales bacterium]MCB8937375.1 CBS domain-containing protein [Ardenticatenaceae bacterium]MCB8975430.1 CBS domain-containing protein [Ardenticatenaceae bacterium]
MRLELVMDWMSRDVVTAVPTLGILDADALMREHNIRRLPVVDNGRLVGIVTYGDIREARPSAATSLSTWEMNYLLANLNLAEVMTKAPIAISPAATIGEAADLMLTNQISGLPVVDGDGRLVGIITESDIFHMVVHQWRQSVEDNAPTPYTHYDGK